MKIKTAELAGAALDWAVAKCEGYATVEHTQLVQVWMERRNARGAMDHFPVSSLRYSTSWELTGPIIDRVKPMLHHGRSGTFTARHPNASQHHAECGSSYLEAFCRCHVAFELGDEVDVPEELLS